jgi:hypothetical protein
MKERKTEGSQIMAFYMGGAKFHASVTHTKAEVEDMIGEALIAKKPAIKLDTVNEDDTIKDDCLIMTFDKLLFVTVLEKNDSGIVALPQGVGRVIQ